MKKNNLYFLFAIMLSAHSYTEAQTFALGARGGISIPNLTAGNGNDNPLNTGYSSRLGPDVAIFAEFKLSKLFSLQPMVAYSSQGGKKKGMQALPTPDAMLAMFPPEETPQYLYANYKSEAKLNYLMIPVLAKFGWAFKNSPLRIYIDAGPFVGFLVSAKQVTSGQSQLYLDPAGQQPLPAGEQSFDHTQDIKNDLRTTNFGIAGNIGLAYYFRKNNIFIEGGSSYGFVNIQKDAQNGKNSTGAATIDIGYSRWFSARPRQK